MSANLDAAQYGVSFLTNLMGVDSTKLYPREMVNQVHEDGEIHGALDKIIAYRLIISHHHILHQDAKIWDAATILLHTQKDQQLPE
jgi:hypothetical protein